MLGFTYLKNKIKSRLQRRIFLYFIIFSLVITLAGGLLFSQFFFNSYIPSERSHALKSSNKAKQSIEFLLNITNNTASLLATNQSIVDGLQADAFERGKSQEEWKREIDLMLKNMIAIHEFIDNIYVLGTDGEFFSSYLDINQHEVENRFTEQVQLLSSQSEYQNGKSIISYIPFFNLNVISYTRPVFQYPDSEPIGLIVFDLNYTYLREVFTFSSLQPDQEEEKILIVDSTGKSIFTFPFNTNLDFVLEEYPELSKGGVELEGRIFGTDSFILSSTVNYSDWIIIRLISKEKINTIIRYITQTGASILFAFIIIALVISFMLSVSITKPIINLNDTITKVEKGNLNVRVVGSGSDEIGQLAMAFNHMVEQLSSLMERTLNEQKMKSDLEFQILQSQINPHFLYNTLDSIKWLAVFQNVENISDMVTSLINLLKYNISRNSKIVQLTDEITCIKDYIEIQKFRFGDEFKLVYEIEPGSEKMYVLKFILQPLVENAISHGFDSIDYIGIITVRSKFIGDKLVLEIADNGKGLDEKDEEFPKSSLSGKKTMHTSIGIQNVRDRIRLYFGEAGSLEMLNNPDKGTTVRITLPVIQKEIQFPEKGRDILDKMETKSESLLSMHELD